MLFIPRPTKQITEKLLELRKSDLRLTVGLITDNISLNAYNSRIGLRADPECDSCSLGAETAKHFLCDCTALSRSRHDVFGKLTIHPSEILDFAPSKVVTFANSTGRLGYPRHRTSNAATAPPSAPTPEVINTYGDGPEGGHQNRM